MKHIYVMAIIAALLCPFAGCKAESKVGALNREATLGKDASYAMGMNTGAGLKGDGLYPNLEEFTQGIKDVLDDSKTRFSMEEAYQIFYEEYRSFMEKRDMANRQVETDYLAENSKKPGITVTGSGLQYEVITEGNGPKPTAADVVRVHYEGALTDGTVFDSSYSRGEPIEFSLGEVIPGWIEGLQLMSVGSKYRLFIPSNLGYGPQGMGGQIPPYATLVFEVELLGIAQ